GERLVRDLVGLAGGVVPGDARAGRRGQRIELHSLMRSSDPDRKIGHGAAPFFEAVGPFSRGHQRDRADDMTETGTRAGRRANRNVFLWNAERAASIEQMFLF